MTEADSPHQRNITGLFFGGVGGGGSTDSLIPTLLKAGPSKEPDTNISIIFTEFWPSKAEL